MKSFSLRLIPAAAAVACMLASTACDKKDSGGSGAASSGGASAPKGISEADAIAKLKAAFDELKALKTKGDEAQKGGNPMAMIPMMKDMFTKISSLPTEGLPADLKAGITKASALFKKVGDAILPAFKDIPSDEKALAAWQEGLKTDPTKAQAIMQTMMQIAPKMEEMKPEKDALEKELKPLFEKYNLPADFLED